MCSRSITWARDSVARVYNPGDIGPSGGLVFYIDSDSGLRYDTAPKTWSDAGTLDAEGGDFWCNIDIIGAMEIAIGTGNANTTAMQSTACTSGAAISARAYAAGYGGWFLPSEYELNAMCNYSRTWTDTPSTDDCTGVQNPTFSLWTFGFADGCYWSSSQCNNVDDAVTLLLTDGQHQIADKYNSLRVPPVRAF